MVHGKTIDVSSILSVITNIDVPKFACLSTQQQRPFSLSVFFHGNAGKHIYKYIEQYYIKYFVYLYVVE